MARRDVALYRCRPAGAVEQLVAVNPGVAHAAAGVRDQRDIPLLRGDPADAAGHVSRAGDGEHVAQLALQHAAATGSCFDDETTAQAYHGRDQDAVQAVRAFGLRRTRYRGLAKTHFQNITTATGINFDRIVAWLDNIPRAKTRTSRFAKLAPLAA